MWGEEGREGDAVGERVDGVINTNLNDGRRGQRAKPAGVYGTRGGEESGEEVGGIVSAQLCVESIRRWNNRRRKTQKKKEDYSASLLLNRSV